MQRTGDTAIEQMAPKTPEIPDTDRSAEALDRALGRAGASGFFRGVASFFLLGDTKGDFESFRYFSDHHRRF